MLLATRGAHASELRLAQDARMMGRELAKTVKPEALDDFLSSLQKHVKKKQPASASASSTSALFGGTAAKGEVASVADLLGAPTPSRDPRLAPAAPAAAAPAAAAWALDTQKTDAKYEAAIKRLDELSARQTKDHAFFGDSFFQLRRRTEDLERRIEQPQRMSAPRDAVASYNEDAAQLKRRLSTIEGELRSELGKFRFAVENRIGLLEAKQELVRRKSDMNEQFLGEVKEKVRQLTSRLESERRDRKHEVETEVKRQLQDNFMQHAAKLLADEVQCRLKVAPATAPRKRSRAAAKDLLPSEDEDGELR